MKRTSLPLRYWERQPPSPGIFICYRNTADDDRYGVELLDEYLQEEFGAQNVFKARRTVYESEAKNFEAILQRASSVAKLMLVVIGKGWMHSISEGKHPWVVREIQNAQNNNVPLLPVYLMTEPTPSYIWQPGTSSRLEVLNVEHLPPPIDPQLAEVEGFNFGTISPRADFQILARHIGQMVPELQTLRPA